MLIVPALLLLAGAYYWLTSGGSVSTDDAQVKQDIVSVSPQMNGQIVQVYVRNGAQVKRGQLLFRIDPQPYQRGARAGGGAARQCAASDAGSADEAAGTGGDITGAEANLTIKRNALGRQPALLRRGLHHARRL